MIGLTCGPMSTVIDLNLNSVNHLTVSGKHTSFAEGEPQSYFKVFKI